MAVGDIGGLVFASGQLCYNPSSVIAPNTFPYGGTALGLIRNTVAKVTRFTTPLREEPFSSQLPFDHLDMGEMWVLVGSFRTYDEDVVNQVFASVVAGQVSGKKGIQYPNGNNYRTGSFLSSKGVRLLLAPDDVDNGRWLLGYNAIPMLDENSELPFQRGEEWIVPFRYVFLPDASNRTVAYHLREDIEKILV